MRGLICEKYNEPDNEPDPTWLSISSVMNKHEVTGVTCFETGFESLFYLTAKNVW